MRRAQMQGTGNAYAIKRPATENHLFIYRLLFQNLMVTANKKIYNRYTEKKKETKHSTNVSYQITTEENKR